MLDSEKLAIAAHLHVMMRRKIGRVTDVEWMIRDASYAREVIRLALSEAEHPELQAWGLKLQACLFPAPAAPPQPSPAQRLAGGVGAAVGVGEQLRNAALLAGRYVGGLR